MNENEEQTMSEVIIQLVENAARDDNESMDACYLKNLLSALCRIKVKTSNQFIVRKISLLEPELVKLVEKASH